MHKQNINQSIVFQRITFLVYLLVIQSLCWCTGYGRVLAYQH